jgi:hypothetical protein
VRVCDEWQIVPAEVWAITVSRAEKAPTVRVFLALLRARIREGAMSHRDRIAESGRISPSCHCASKRAT